MKKNIIILSIVVVAILLLTGGLLIYGEKSEVPNTNIIKNNDTVTDHGTTTEDNIENQGEDQAGLVNDPSLYKKIGRLYVYKDSEMGENFHIEDGTTKTSLCGSFYQTRNIIIDGVNVIQRIEEILAQNSEKGKWLCDIWVGRAKDEGGMIEQGEEIYLRIAGPFNIDGGGYELTISLSQKPSSSFPLYIYPKKNSITYTEGGFLGKFR